MAKKKKEEVPNGILMYLNNLNNSKFLTGLIVILLNVGGKYVSVSLSKNQEEYFKNVIGHHLIILAACWMATRDIILSVILTGIFIVLTKFLLNDESRFSIIPNNWKKEKVEFMETKGSLKSADIDQAIKLLEKVKNSK
jgi:hypothetical protein